MIKTVFLILMLAGMATVPVKAQTAAEKQVAAAVETLTKAMIDANKTALENISSDALS